MQSVEISTEFVDAKKHLVREDKILSNALEKRLRFLKLIACVIKIECRYTDRNIHCCKIIH